MMDFAQLMRYLIGFPRALVWALAIFFIPMEKKADGMAGFLSRWPCFSA